MRSVKVTVHDTSATDIDGHWTTIAPAQGHAWMVAAFAQPAELVLASGADNGNNMQFADAYGNPLKSFGWKVATVSEESRPVQVLQVRQC